MKTSGFSLFLISLFLSLQPPSLYAQNEDLRRYYPLGDGYKWTYEVSRADRLATEDIEMTGEEKVEGIKTIKVESRDGTYECTAADAEGVKVYKEVDVDGSYDIYKPPLIIFSFNIEKVKKFKEELSYLSYTKEGKLKDTGDISGEMRFKGRENITVPAGSFEDCLRINTISEWKEKDGSFGESRIEAWLVKDIGLVRKVMTETEYDIDNGDVSVDVSVTDWRLKKAVLDNMTYGK